MCLILIVLTALNILNNLDKNIWGRIKDSVDLLTLNVFNISSDSKM
jgi:hypothetical protein